MDIVPNIRERRIQFALASPAKGRFRLWPKKSELGAFSGPTQGNFVAASCRSPKVPSPRPAISARIPGLAEGPRLGQSDNAAIVVTERFAQYFSGVLA